MYESPDLASDQRLGNQSEELTVIFSTADGEQKEYSPGTLAEYQQFQIGSTWTLNMNALGNITSVEP
jgi:hypothetical protein